MTDYTWGTGSSGTMMIRDTNPGGASGNVEFWLNSNNGTTFNHALPWYYVINGSYSGPLTHNYNAGSGWNLLGQWNITTSQTVTFGIGNTGTSGFGGPSEHSQFISRATVPAAPSNPTFTNVGPVSIAVNWTPNSNGGAAIDKYEVSYGTDNSVSQFQVETTSSPYTVTSLTPGTVYYFWVRAHNSVGWGSYSAQFVSQQTIAGVRIKDGGVWKIAVPYVKDAGTWKLARPYVRVAGVWKETI